MRKICFGVMVLLIICGSAMAGQTYTYPDIVKMLSDMERLSILPVQGETCAQFSSYDLRSKYDEKTNSYINWDANGDNSGLLKDNGHGAGLMADIKGPGCIWRIWSAQPTDMGHVKIFLDGATEPTVDLPFSGYFNLENEPFTYPALVHDAASGKNCYVPIPFQKSCQVIAEADWGNYYHITYSKFPAGTTVPTFKRNLSTNDRMALSKADFTLRKRLGTDPAGHRAGEKNLSLPVSLAPGAKTVVSRLNGTQAITYLGVRGSLKAIAPETWRNVVLKIYWDGEKSPSVWVPLGDFFGTGPGLNKYSSLPLGVSDDRLYSYWYMPFTKGAVVELVNEGKTSLDATFDITCASVTKPINALGRFHSKWHRDAFQNTDKGREIDWTMLTTQGKGRYCGVMLEVWNPKGGWWGEGDEKFFVDGEKFPSTFGTGSEDFFGYAWCNPRLFQNAFHNQTLNDGNNVGHVSVNRWQIADNVPFQKSFEGDIEKYFKNDLPTLFASTSYWYLAPGGVDPYQPVPVDERTFYVKP